MGDRPSGDSRAGYKSQFERLLARLFRRTDDKEDLMEQLREAQEHAVIDADAVSMMEGVMQVADLQVRDLMITRSQMDVIDIDDPLEKILQVVVSTAHSRFPVIEGKRDNVIGILLAKDLLKCMAQQETDLRGMLRPAVFVPESKRLNVMLRDFRVNRNHIAIVVDEYGGVAGMITIEDVLEQIVGDIEDEHDIEEDDDNIIAMPRQHGRFRVRALTSLEQFNAAFSASLADEQVDTIGGFVTDHFGRLPHRGEQIDIDGFRFEVQRADARQIHVLVVQRITAPDMA
ncbi:MAG: CBS domain-containing protein [Burkholderiaceae bacterium]|nr:CBS domain-containing protein [Burkholderiaceae bacterium]